MVQVVVISPEEAAYPKDQRVTWFPTLPALHALGNINLLKLPMTDLFCSRKWPGDGTLKAYDLTRELGEKETPVTSGFHTTVEKDMLEILLKGKRSIVICPARGLEGMRIPKTLREGVDQGRILLVSMFGPQIQRATKGTAHQRNLLAAALASERVYVHVAPGGETEKVAYLISEHEL